MNWALLKAYGVQVFIAVDQLLNALIPPPPLDGTLSYADETLSARSYRAHRDGKLLGKITMPVIDALFWWQGRITAITHIAKRPSASRCLRSTGSYLLTTLLQLLGVCRTLLLQTAT